MLGSCADAVASAHSPPLPAHGSVVYLPCLYVAYHLATAKWTTINKCLGINAPFPDAKPLPACTAVIYLACTHRARHCSLTKRAYVLERFGVIWLVSASFARCIGLLWCLLFSFAFLVSWGFPHSCGASALGRSCLSLVPAVTCPSVVCKSPGSQIAATVPP